MNRERLLKLAKIVETSETYDQDFFYHPCKAPACVAGHAVAEFDPKAFRRVTSGSAQPRALHDMAEELLGLTHEQSDALFSSDDDSGQPIYPTRYQAAETLRDLVNTGEVYWDL